MASEPVERALLMAGQAQATANANTVQAIMGQERRINDLEVANSALATKIDRLVNGQGSLMNKHSFLEREIKKLNSKPKKKRENQPQARDNGPLSRVSR